jgi:DNA-binding MarR family transcriptional regulator
MSSIPSNGSRAFHAFIALLRSQKPWLVQRLAPFDLTSQQFQGLETLAGSPDSTMRAFAENMFCDASNATGVVDRLEQRGLVERRVSETDRRVKVVRLTPAGQRLYRRAQEALFAQAPPPIEGLTAADQRTLREILERALRNAET